LPHPAALSYFKLTLLSCNDDDDGVYKSAFPNILQQFVVWTSHCCTQPFRC